MNLLALVTAHNGTWIWVSSSWSASRICTEHSFFVSFDGNTIIFQQQKYTCFHSVAIRVLQTISHFVASYTWQIHFWTLFLQWQEKIWSMDTIEIIWIITVIMWYQKINMPVVSHCFLLYTACVDSFRFIIHIYNCLKFSSCFKHLVSFKLPTEKSPRSSEITTISSKSSFVTVVRFTSIYFWTWFGKVFGCTVSR